MMRRSICGESPLIPISMPLLQEKIDWLITIHQRHLVEKEKNVTAKGKPAP